MADVAFAKGGLGDWIRERIAQSGKTPADIADLSGVARPILYRFVNRQRDLSLETIEKLLPVLDAAVTSHMREQVEKAATMMRMEGKLTRVMTELRERREDLEQIQRALYETGRLVKKILDTQTDLDELPV